MSGRSAYVRKEKTNVKHGVTVVGERNVTSSNGSSNGSKFEELSRQPSSGPVTDFYGFNPPPTKQVPSARSIISSNSDDGGAYARVRNPPTPVIDVSGIEKSTFRQLMDKKSEGVRKGLSFGFGKKKKKNDDDDYLPESRPLTSATMRPDVYEVEAPTEFLPQPQRARPVPSRENMDDGRGGHDGRGGPPQGKLPPLPPPPQLKRWAGTGRPPQPWNKLRKDPELWDPNGDTLVFLGQETHHSSRPPPSFRISSHVLENTESRFFVTILREGYTDANNNYNMPASPPILGGQNRRSPVHGPASGSLTSPTLSNASMYDGGGHQDHDGQISYELYFPPPPNISMVDTLRHHVTTRNVFALLYQTSLAGFNLYQSLTDLYERLQLWMAPECDITGMMIDYISARGIDDVRNDPLSAVSLLAWAESRNVRWQEGWREAFIHCSGLSHLVDSVPEQRHVTPITKALLDRASLEVQVRVQAVEDRLADFQFGDMFPPDSNISPERSSFERLRHFLKSYYESCCGTWPPMPQSHDEQWLNRSLTQRLEQDFGALYDYLVDRNVRWANPDGRNGQRRIMVRTDRTPFEADSPELAITDILLNFDAQQQYPHIPYPYPLVPQSIPPRPKNPSRPTDDKLAERKAALAYTEATNIYRLGSDFVSNRLVDAFVRFEKTDNAADFDPFAARRGRWILLYGILQAIASISVDTPGMRYKDGVSYHLSPRLRGTPPWKSTDAAVNEASHEGSHCWLAPARWNPEAHPKQRAIPPPNSRRNGMSSVRSSGAASTPTESESGSPRFDDVPPLLEGRRMRRPAPGRRSAATSGTESDTASSVGTPIRSSRRARASQRELEQLPRMEGYGPGIEKIEEGIGALGLGADGLGRGGDGGIDISQWPIRSESRLGGVGTIAQLKEIERGAPLIRDFDEYRF